MEWNPTISSTTPTILLSSCLTCSQIQSAVISDIAVIDATCHGSRLLPNNPLICRVKTFTHSECPIIFGSQCLYLNNRIKQANNDSILVVLCCLDLNLSLCGIVHNSDTNQKLIAAVNRKLWWYVLEFAAILNPSSITYAYLAILNRFFSINICRCKQKQYECVCAGLNLYFDSLFTSSQMNKYGFWSSYQCWIILVVVVVVVVGVCSSKKSATTMFFSSIRFFSCLFSFVVMMICRHFVV